MLKAYTRAIGMMVGLILGAGIFALPYVFAKAGVFWGLFHFVLVFSLLLYVSYLYGEISFFVKGRHRFTGYAELLAGKKAKGFALITTIFSFYGALLIYGVLGGIFLKTIFNSKEVGFYTTLFFIITGLLTRLSLKKVAAVNFYLTIPLFGFIAYLMAKAWPFISAENIFSAPSALNEWWFIPFGVWLFALSGYSAIPEARDLFKKLSIRHFKKSIFLSLAISGAFMLVFSFIILGLSGQGTSEDAFGGVKNILGEGAIILGSIMGFLAVFTSYLALAEDMENIYTFDYKIKGLWPWLLTVLPPLGLFWLGLDGFVKTLGFIGALGLGTSGVLIILMARGLRKKIDAREDEIIESYPEKGELLRLNKFTEVAIISLVLIGVAYEFWNILN